MSSFDSENVYKTPEHSLTEKVIQSWKPILVKIDEWIEKRGNYSRARDSWWDAEKSGEKISGDLHANVNVIWRDLRVVESEIAMAANRAGDITWNWYLSVGTVLVDKAEAAGRARDAILSEGARLKKILGEAFFPSEPVIKEAYQKLRYIADCLYCLPKQGWDWPWIDGGNPCEVNVKLFGQGEVHGYSMDVGRIRSDLHHAIQVLKETADLSLSTVGQSDTQKMKKTD
jgi:hypothetical protein